jgi:hypothetical protein
MKDGSELGELEGNVDNEGADEGKGVGCADG